MMDAPTSFPFNDDDEEEDQKIDIKKGDEFIINPYYEKKILTVYEAIDTINHLSGVLLIHERRK